MEEIIADALTGQASQEELSKLRLWLAGKASLQEIKPDVIKQSEWTETENREKRHILHIPNKTVPNKLVSNKLVSLKYCFYLCAVVKT